MMHQIEIIGENRLVPVGKIICVGRNYSEHIRELGNETPEQAILFMKPASSIIRAGDQIIIPDYSHDCHHEVELAILIGRTAKGIREEEVYEYVAGYGVAIDLTLRDVQG